MAVRETGLMWANIAAGVPGWEASYSDEEAVELDAALARELEPR